MCCVLWYQSVCLQNFVLFWWWQVQWETKLCKPISWLQLHWAQIHCGSGYVFLDGCRWVVLVKSVRYCLWSPFSNIETIKQKPKSPFRPLSTHVSCILNETQGILTAHDRWLLRWNASRFENSHVQYYVLVSNHNTSRNGEKAHFLRWQSVEGYNIWVELMVTEGQH